MSWRNIGWGVLIVLGVLQAWLCAPLLMTPLLIAVGLTLLIRHWKKGKHGDDLPGPDRWSV